MVIVRIIKSWESPLLEGALAKVIGYDQIPWSNPAYGMLDLEVLGLGRPHRTTAYPSEVSVVSTT